MESISILIKTENCKNIFFNWENVENSEILFIQQHDFFKEVVDIQSTFKTLFDFALFLNNKKLYGYLNKKFLIILKIFHKYLEKNNNVSSIYFYIKKSLLLWKMDFTKNNITLFKYIMTFDNTYYYKNDKNDDIHFILQMCNKTINNKNIYWFDFTHDLLFYI